MRADIPSAMIALPTALLAGIAVSYYSGYASVGEFVAGLSVGALVMLSAVLFLAWGGEL